MLSRHRVSSALGRMFMAHLHRWALAFLGAGFGGSSVNAAESAPRQPASLPMESRRSKAELDLRRRGAFWLQGGAT